MEPCKICGDETCSAFNIDFKRVPICEYCANRIFIQQAEWFVNENRKEQK